MRGPQQPLRRADARQQRRRGRDDQPRGARSPRACSARARAAATRKCGVMPRYGIDLQRRQRQHRALDVRLGRAFERGVEEPRVGRRSARRPCPSARRAASAPASPRAAATAASALAAGVSPAVTGASLSRRGAGGRLAEKSAKRERRGGRHQRYMRIAHPAAAAGGRANVYCPIRVSAVRGPCRSARWSRTLAPAPCGPPGRRAPRRRRGRRCCPAPQSAPLTSTSGWIAADDRVRRLLVEDRPPRRRTPSASSTSARSCSGLIGRSGPCSRAPIDRS